MDRVQRDGLRCEPQQNAASVCRAGDFPRPLRRPNEVLMDPGSDVTDSKTANSSSSCVGTWRVHVTKVQLRSGWRKPWEMGKITVFFHSFWKAWQVLGENLEGKILCFCEVLTVQIPCLDLLQQTLLNWWRRHGHWNGHITWTEKFNASAWWRMENTLGVTEKVALHTKVLPSVRRKRWVLCGCEVALSS